MSQPEPHLLEMAIQTVLHKNKANLERLADNSDAIHRIAHEIQNQFAAFQKITDQVVHQWENSHS